MQQNYTCSYNTDNTQSHYLMMHSSYMGLRETLQALMDERGENPNSLAPKTGVPQPTIFRILTGESKEPRRTNIEKLARFFGVTAEEMYSGVRQRSAEPSPTDLPPISPLPDTQSASSGAESAPSYTKDSAVILNFQSKHPEQAKDSDGYVIRQYNSGGSMGNGLALPDQPGVIENWGVSREWLNKNIRVHTGIQNLCIVTGFGPSMQPMFNPGDPLLVDTGVKSVIADGIYFFRVGQEGFIKQLQKIPTESGIKYVAKSKNPDYDNFEITGSMDFEVLGRVVRVWCGTDF